MGARRVLIGLCGGVYLQAVLCVHACVDTHWHASLSHVNQHVNLFVRFILRTSFLAVDLD